MSSIAYVADEEMLEYDRLCARRTILFWRLSTHRITDFEPGDLLFFYAKPHIGRRKAFIGYAHYEKSIRMSLKQMWKQYGGATGYSDEEKLRTAVSNACRGEIPKQMLCLYLNDVVFFSTPLYPEECGIQIAQNLESYQYLDRDDPRITLHILQEAEKHGIDIWSADRTKKPEDIFHNDELRHGFAVMNGEIGPMAANEKERQLLHRLAKDKCMQKGWELIRGSKTDCIHLTETQIHIAVPFTCIMKDRKIRRQEYAGRLALYRYYASRFHIERKIYFQLLTDQDDADLRKLVETINHE